MEADLGRINLFITADVEESRPEPYVGQEAELYLQPVDRVDNAFVIVDASCGVTLVANR
jgi:hypothetical protein